MLEIFLTDWSYLGIIIFLILTGCGLPIPEEVPIVMAGILAANGQLDVGLAFAACVVGAILGDILMYAIGYHFGHNLLKEHPLFARFVRADREAKFEELIERHGLKVLLVARFMVGVRSPVYLSAGVLRVPPRRFVMMDILCATLVVGVFCGLAYAFGNQIYDWLRQAEMGLTAVVFAIVAAAGGYYYLRRRRRVARERELDQAQSSPSDGDAADDRQEKHVA